METTEKQYHNFIVGATKERITVSEDILGQCTESLRNFELDDGCLVLPEVDAVSFKIFLKYISGTENLETNLEVQTVYDICHLANRFHLNDLREKAAHLLSPFGVYDLFIALRCVVMCNATCIEPAVQKIVQEETMFVFEQPQFKLMDQECLLYILKQDTLNAEEIDIWKAVLVWVEHRASEYEVVAQLLEEPAKYIRFNSFTMEQITQIKSSDFYFESEKLRSEINRASGSLEPFCQKRLQPSFALFLYRNHHGENDIMEMKKSSCVVNIENGGVLKLKSLVCYGRKITGSPYSVTVTLTIFKIWACEFIKLLQVEEEVTVSDKAAVINLADKNIVLFNYRNKIDLEFDKPHPARMVSPKSLVYEFGWGRVKTISSAINPNIRDPPTTAYYSHLGKIYLE